jgi:hypothetical protein
MVTGLDKLRDYRNSSADIVPFQSNSSHIPLSQREIHNRRALLARCDERGDIAKLAPCVAAVPDDFNAMGRICDVNVFLTATQRIATACECGSAADDSRVASGLRRAT